METNRLSSVLFLSLCCLGGLFASCSSEDHEDILSKWSWDREEPNPDIMNIYEEMMAENGERIYAKRQAFIEEFSAALHKKFDTEEI